MSCSWISIAGPVVEAVGFKAGSGPGLQGAAFGGTGFTPTGIINDGILSSAPGKVIKQYVCRFFFPSWHVS